MGTNVIIHGKDSTDVLSNDAGKVKTSPVLVTSNAFHMLMQAGSLWAYGNYPNTLYLPWTGAAGTADTDVLYSPNDVSIYDYHTIENESGVAIDVYVSVDGTNLSTAAAAVALLDDVTTGGGIKVIEIPDNKIGVLEGKFMKIEVRQAAAGAITAGTVRGAHGVK